MLAVVFEVVPKEKTALTVVCSNASMPQKIREYIINSHA